MSAEPTKAQRAVQTGSSGEAAAVGLEVGGVHNKDDLRWLDLWALNPETRAYLKAYRRNAACSHAQQRSEGAGDGSQEITTPESNPSVTAGNRRFPAVTEGLLSGVVISCEPSPAPSLRCCACEQAAFLRYALR